MGDQKKQKLPSETGVPWGLFPGRYLALFTNKKLFTSENATKDGILSLRTTIQWPASGKFFYVLGLVDSAECNAEPPLTEYHTHKLNTHAQGRVHQHAKLAGGPNPASPYKDT